MKVIALILAGGSGTRMNTSIPKQFIEVDNTPIISYTIANFEKNNLVDNIVIVCNPDYVDLMKKIVAENGHKKVCAIVEGGKTGHESSRNGVLSLTDKISNEDILIIHDAVRPILPQPVINTLIETCSKFGNACTAVPCYETIVCTSDRISGNSQIDRNSFMRVQTPQAYKYGFIKDLYLKSIEDNINDFVYANTMAIHYGKTIYFSKGFDNNIKITTTEDIALFKALKTFSDDELMSK